MSEVSTGSSPSRPEPARFNPLVRLPVVSPARLAPTWRAASPRRIETALAAAQRRDPGGWYVVGASTDLPRNRSVVRTIADREVVLWRSSAGIVAGPGACPHLGAKLDGCPVRADAITCSWHGLRLGPDDGPGWTPYRAVDDGVLLWVQLPTEGETPTAAPVLTARPDPARSLAAVVALPARCEPADIIANRLDPWHGAWLHPYAFSHLTVDESASSPDRLVLEVAYRVSGAWAVPVVAEFTCPDARTIAMTILAGEGSGSVVETHATPVRSDDGSGNARTVMTEATIAHSDRAGFRWAQRVGPVLRVGIRQAARRLWADDLVYAERLYELRLRSRGQ